MCIYNREAQFRFILAVISVLSIWIFLSVGCSWKEEAVCFFFCCCLFSFFFFFCIINEQSIVSLINQIKSDWFAKNVLIIQFSWKDLLCDSNRSRMSGFFSFVQTADFANICFTTTGDWLLQILLFASAIQRTLNELPLIHPSSDVSS